MLSIKQRSWVALMLTAFLLDGCGGQTSDRDVNSREHRMVGVLNIGAHEGEEFQECPLEEPWRCFASASPPCAFQASDNAGHQVRAALEGAGILSEGAGTFGVVLLGTRVSNVGAGHLGAYDCEITAHSIQDIREVSALPPSRG